MVADSGGTAATGTGGEPEASDSLRTFGAMAQALREHAGLSREELAEIIGYSKHMLASVESRRSGRLGQNASGCCGSGRTPSSGSSWRRGCSSGALAGWR